MTKISIITVCLNCVNLIERTIQSVLGQDYFDIEYIIVDGGSTDGTLLVIQRFKDKLDCLISEPDKGIFDAMNKGLKEATGEWVVFLNAGDQFYSENVLSSIFTGNEFTNIAVIYGSVFSQNRIILPTSLDSMRFGGIMACHQSIFYNIEICGSELYYKTNHLYYGDIELTRRLYIRGMYFHKVDIVVSRYLGGGVSSRISWKARYAKFDYLFDHYGLVGVYYGVVSKLIYLLER